MTREQFLLDTIEYYSENPSFRCVTNINCAYSAKTLGKEGDGCAIGRWLDENLKLELDTFDEASVTNKDVFNRLPKWMQKLRVTFLESVQQLHDDGDYWDGGLSEHGIEYVNEIINYFDLNIPKYERLYQKESTNKWKTS